jgi:hypothetical protein
MKSKINYIKMLSKAKELLIIALLILQTTIVLSQEQDSVQTLLRPDAKIVQIFAPEIKVNSIQGDMGTLLGIYGGPLINRTFLIGVCGGINLGHPHVNYGYIGGIFQYIFRPSEVVHVSSQLVLAYGTTKDYENPKSSLFDNFWNISGTSFYMMEPGINFEMNINSRLILVAGVSYRYVSGLNENSVELSRTHVTNRDMSGVNFSLGVKFRKG